MGFVKHKAKILLSTPHYYVSLYRKHIRIYQRKTKRELVLPYNTLYRIVSRRQILGLTEKD